MPVKDELYIIQSIKHFLTYAMLSTTPLSSKVHIAGRHAIYDSKLFEETSLSSATLGLALQFATCSRICLLVYENVVSQVRQPQYIGTLGGILASGSGTDDAEDSALILLYHM